MDMDVNEKIVRKRLQVCKNQFTIEYVKFEVPEIIATLIQCLGTETDTTNTRSNGIPSMRYQTRRKARKSFLAG